ncbi:hypothetical protein [Aquisphaera insulae]|uniref:hypothetical protein n=1 Tax=Aquisphaera insulae TaxID=2712864 RepID=UPI00202F8C2D|nr:hypothetical protein [Aquisphaera insulae]
MDTRKPWLSGRLALALGAALASGLVEGCGSEPGPHRRPVEGAVELDGKPLTTGTITFAPVNGGPGAFGEITDGTYRFGKSDGPAPGRHKVEIVSVQSSGRTIPSPDIPGETIEESRNIIPPDYNAHTTLEVDVKPDGDNSFRFELASISKATNGKTSSRTARR